MCRNNTFVKRLNQFGEFAHTFGAKSQSCVAHRQGCNAVDTCGALEECGHPVCFVCLSRSLHLPSQEQDPPKAVVSCES